MTRPAARPRRRLAPGRARLAPGLALATALAALAGPAARADDLDEVASLHRTGRYDLCAARAGAAIDAGARGEGWYRIKALSELARGRLDSAAETVDAARRRYSDSLTLLLISRDVDLARGRSGDDALDEIDRIRRFARGPDSVDDQVALGRALLIRGADAKEILDRSFDDAIRRDPGHLGACYAAAELALAKQDDALAARTLAKAPKAAGADPHYHHLLARAFEVGDPARSRRETDEALGINPGHVESLIRRAEDRIDAEDYAGASAALGLAIAVDATCPEAWALRAVLAHLDGDPAGEQVARAEGLKHRGSNPAVDALIGRGLSRKYRFAEGASRQRKALEADPRDIPARIQLAQDLLRLGEEPEGWGLAEGVFKDDPYNVVAFNLIGLRDRMAGFRTIEAGGISVRMDAAEASIYGDRVLDLLRRAKSTLGARYGVELPGPIVVEIFPRRREFAVRTFALPGADGLLGVCFGRVITAISPAAQGEEPSNWEAVLWHELCHSITLAKTRNTMPRWLSEGISVYEESRRDPSWGAPLTPQFRSMLLGDDLSPISRLSAAFLAARSPAHVQLAYIESAMAVEFLVELRGFDALVGVLDDLGRGMKIDAALAARSMLTADDLDRRFVEFARRKAALADPSATWADPKLPKDAGIDALRDLVRAQPGSIRGWQALGKRLMAGSEWAEAAAALGRFRDLDPSYVGPENAYELLAAVASRASDPRAERSHLEALASRDGSDLAAILRLLEMDRAGPDWEATRRDAARALAVNPLIPAPHRALADAAEALGDREGAASAFRSVVALDASDPAGTHLRMAVLLRGAGRADEARREVLKALEEAPRYLDAHRLLRELGPSRPAATTTTGEAHGHEH